MAEKKTIEYFYKKGDVSFKAFVISRELGIINLLQLKNFVDKNDNFLRIKSCSHKQNYELLKLYEDHFLNFNIKKSKKKKSILKVNPKNKSSTINNPQNPKKRSPKKNNSIISSINSRIDNKPELKSITGTIRIDYLYSVDVVNKKIYEFLKKKGIYNLNGLHDYIKKNENFFGTSDCTIEENYIILELYENFYLNFINIEKIEIKNTDNKTIRDIKKIIIKGLSGKINKLDLNESDNNKNNVSEIEYQFDGYSFIVNVVEMDMAPLYWVKREGLTQYIFFNKAHQKSGLLPESGFVKFLFALTRTSLSFSDESGEIFLNRLKNYLDLI